GQGAHPRPQARAGLRLEARSARGADVMAMTRRRALRLALEIGVFVAILLAIGMYRSRDAASGQAPTLAGISTAGAPLALDAAPGEPVLVHFWGSWCGVCRAEEGTIHALAEDHRVLTVAVGSGDRATVASYLDERGLSFPTIVDHAGVLA